MTVLVIEMLLVVIGLALAVRAPDLAVLGSKRGRVSPGTQPIPKAYTRLAWLGFSAPLLFDALTRVAERHHAEVLPSEAAAVGVSLACLFSGIGALRLACTPGSQALGRDASPEANRKTALMFGFILILLGVLGMFLHGISWWAQQSHRLAQL